MEKGFTQEDLRVLNCLSFDDFVKVMKSLGLVGESYIEAKFESCQKNIGNFLMSELDNMRFKGLLEYCQNKRGVS